MPYNNLLKWKKDYMSKHCSSGIAKAQRKPNSKKKEKKSAFISSTITKNEPGVHSLSGFKMPTFNDTGPLQPVM